MLVPILLSARLVLGVIFLLAGLSKIASPSAFTDDVMEYQLVSGSLAKIVAYSLPPLELILAALCIAGIILPLTASIAILLLLVFTIAIALNLARGRQFSCHCFGSSNATSTIGPATILRNLFLIAIALFLAISSFTTQNLGLAAVPWQTDIQLLTHLDTFIPMVVTVTVVLSIFSLLNEVDAMLQMR
jgi:uncharacterized membrane protein YphA (DoxX/SURF4 family)